MITYFVLGSILICLETIVLYKSCEIKNLIFFVKIYSVPSLFFTDTVNVWLLVLGLLGNRY